MLVKVDGRTGSDPFFSPLFYLTCNFLTLRFTYFWKQHIPNDICMEVYPFTVKLYIFVAFNYWAPGRDANLETGLLETKSVQMKVSISGKAQPRTECTLVSGPSENEVISVWRVSFSFHYIQLETLHWHSLKFARDLLDWIQFRGFMVQQNITC